jgi:hypothetical protein
MRTAAFSRRSDGRHRPGRGTGQHHQATQQILGCGQVDVTDHGDRMQVFVAPRADDVRIRPHASGCGSTECAHGRAWQGACRAARRDSSCAPGIAAPGSGASKATRTLPPHTLAWNLIEQVLRRRTATVSAATDGAVSRVFQGDGRGRLQVLFGLSCVCDVVDQAGEGPWRAGGGRDDRGLGSVRRRPRVARRPDSRATRRVRTGAA